MSTHAGSSSSIAASSREQTRLNFVKALSSAFKEDQSKDERKAPSNQSQQNISINPTASNSAVKLSIEGAQRLIQTFTKSMVASQFKEEVRSTLVQLFRSEISAFIANPQLLLVPLGTVVDHDLLRRVLLVSDTSPVADDKEDKLLCSQLYLRAVMLAAYSSLPTELHAIKKKLVQTAMQEAHSRAQARDPESIKLIANEVLRANEEPEYPFHELMERSDPMDPHYKEIGLTFSGTFQTLNIRKPNLFSLVVYLLNAFICKAANEVGYFRFEGPPQLSSTPSQTGLASLNLSLSALNSHRTVKRR